MSLSRLSYLLVGRGDTKPTKPVRFKDGDMKFKQEIIANNPIQNNRWNALNAVKSKITTDWSYNFDLDYNEAVHFLSVALGSMTSTDIGSTTGAVFRHVITVANSLPSLTIEQLKGDQTDTSNNRQNYMVDRAFGVMVDELTIQGSEGILNLAIKAKAQGIFQKAAILANVTSGSGVVISVATAEGLFIGDSLNVFDKTPQNEVVSVTAKSIAARTVTATLTQAHTVANEAKIELVPQVVSYSTPAKVATFTHARFQFGADLTAAASANLENVENWEITFKNGLEERYGSLRASPSVIAPKGASCMLKYTKYFENVEDRDRYLNQTKRSLIMTITNDEIIASSDTNQAKYSIKFEASDVRFTEYDVPTGTDELYAVSCQAECYYDFTDGNAVRFTIQNSKVWTFYTA